MKKVVFVVLFVLSTGSQAAQPLQIVGSQKDPDWFDRVPPRIQDLLFEAVQPPQKKVKAVSQPSVDLQSISYESSYTYGELGSLFLRHGLRASGYQYSSRGLGE